MKKKSFKKHFKEMYKKVGVILIVYKNFQIFTI